MIQRVDQFNNERVVREFSDSLLGVHELGCLFRVRFHLYLVKQPSEIKQSRFDKLPTA